MGNVKTIRERATDVVKDVLMWIVVTGGAFVYWIAVLLIISLVLMNVWHTTFESILKYTIILTVITSVIYLIRMVYRKVK